MAADDIAVGRPTAVPLRIDWVPIATLRPNPRNPRTHSRQQIRQLAANIRQSTVGTIYIIPCRMARI